MTQNQRLLSQLQVSGVKLDQLITAAETAGAFGAKLSGAGGGDCMVALTDDPHQTQVKEAITSAGGTVLHVELNAPGVRCEK
jgi:mevalonate kinase